MKKPKKQKPPPRPELSENAQAIREAAPGPVNVGPSKKARAATRLPKKKS